MNNRRLELHKILCDILRCPENGENCRAYYQPPSGKDIKYPCVIYEIDDMDSRSANNSIYSVDKRYSMTVIDKRPDSPIANEIIHLPTSNFNRIYTRDNLYHTTFTIYVKGGNQNE